MEPAANVPRAVGADAHIATGDDLEQVLATAVDEAVNGAAVVVDVRVSGTVLA
jgi:hypothetical protein